MPALNEERSVPFLLKDIYKNLNEADISYEIILVDDGSENNLEKYIEKNDKLRIYRNSYTKGQTQSILYGIEESNFEYIFILDSDGQNPPSEMQEGKMQKWQKALQAAKVQGLKKQKCQTK